ncbi:signal peptidase I [Haloplanus rallus]|uniref:Signal peptidase I n=1 Tax=Haloplanus rallus TaxID=1816183 RepID=A0A6B9FBX5_9EURY|nr:signal peptidase I [Haloplanus rallus]QGX93660.1 signal peptidase I [Haloplanus rallus]
MSPRRMLSVAGEVLAIVVVVALVAGQALGYPVLLGFVETGSMEPTLNPGDGFVAIPTAIDGDVEEGDVIVFRAEQIQGGGLTTHRIVGETERGYVTRGDANPFTDQDGNEPPVKDAQIVAKAWQVGGSVVVIPHLGTAVMGLQSAVTDTQRTVASVTGSRSLLGTQGLTYLLLGLSVLLYLFDLFVTDGTDRDRSRSRSRDRGLSSRVIVAGLAALIVLTATASMVVPAGTQEFGVVSADFDSKNPTIIRQGTAESLTYRVPNAGVVPVVVYLTPASEGVETTPERLRVPGRSSANATLTLSAPPETGYYRRYVSEYRYLAVLPPSVIDACYRVHPWLPIFVVDAVIGVPFYLFGMSLVGSGRLRSRSRSRDGVSTLRRLLRRYG